MIKDIFRLFINAYIYPLSKNNKLRRYACSKLQTDYLIRSIKLLSGKIDEKPCILDIGAFEGKEGDSTPTYAKAFPDNKIFAFEPCRSSFQKLLANINKYKNVKAFNVALSDEAKDKVLHITSSKDCNSLLEPDSAQVSNIQQGLRELFDTEKQELVKVNTLDNFVKEKGIKDIAIAKIDTQGSELSILKGAKESLGNTILIVLEVGNHNTYKNSAKYYEIDQFLRDNNFSLIDLISYHYSNNRLFEWDAIYINNKYSHYID